MPGEMPKVSVTRQERDLVIEARLGDQGVGETSSQFQRNDLRSIERSSDPVALKNFEDRQFLDAPDLVSRQTFFRQNFCEHNR